MTTRHFIRIAIVLGMTALLIACGSPAPQPPAGATSSTGSVPATAAPPPLATPEKINVEVGPNEPQIFMLEPQDGSSLESPFFFRVGVSNFVIPLSSMQLHIAIDATCTPAGQAIPGDDAQHITLPRGVLQDPRFELPPGPHRLCLQAANQDGIALAGPGMSRVIDVTIEARPTPAYD